MTDARLEKCLKLEKERSFEKLNLNLFNKMFSSCEICGQVLDNIFTPVVVNISNSFTDFEKFPKRTPYLHVFTFICSHPNVSLLHPNKQVGLWCHQPTS